MTNRERFVRIAKSESTDDLFLPFGLNYGWFMEETVERWRTEGLPEDADLHEFFGFDRIEFTGGGPYSLIPSFEEELLSEDGETQIVRDQLGITKRIFKKNTQSKMPQWLDFPVKSRQDFEAFKKRLDPTSPGRRPASFDELKARWKDRDHPLGLAAGSFYGHTLQRWVGPENVCMLFYDDPTLVHEMLDYLEEFFLALIEPFVREVEFEFASFGEDIAYKGRSFISPRTFKEFIQPHYVRICEVLRSHGIEVIFVDSDGYLDELIPLWMEVGINGFSPLEVAAGMDAESLKREYGNDIVLVGNVDKRALSKGKDAIDAEVGKVQKLLALGGYFPAVDHSVPPDVPFDSFRYFVDALKALG